MFASYDPCQHQLIDEPKVSEVCYSFILKLLLLGQQTQFIFTKISCANDIN
jgi:hypothetical protein